MGRYLNLVLSRVFQFLISMLALIFFCLFLLQLFPGSPFVEEKKFDPLIVQKLEEFYGLNLPLHLQFTNYVRNVLRGELGESMHYPGRSVSSLIAEHGAFSFQLGISAFLLAILFSVVISYSAFFFRMQRRIRNYTLIGLSVPSFVLGPFLIWLICYQWQLLPSALLEEPKSYILPIFLLAFKPTLTLSRTLAAQLDHVFKEKYIQTAKAMGFSRQSVVGKWAFKNAMIAYVSQTSFIFAYLISGSLLVEVMFAIPGLGQQFVESILNRDWTLVMGLTVFYGFLLMLSQFFSDLLISILDPRVDSL